MLRIAKRDSYELTKYVITSDAVNIYVNDRYIGTMHYDEDIRTDWTINNLQGWFVVSRKPNKVYKITDKYRGIYYGKSIEINAMSNSVISVELVDAQPDMQIQSKVLIRGFVQL